ncbi:FtsH protease activity modulator HflK [Cypionkella sp.]|uniref:FtsH protease activity modulator HflK n=1 Tax=Cypionkella sp. TaxID=2811411 RepID=UPI0026122205|nr:FtsH protease activity modulator HflK [Cypionkella sp.]MDB5665164.1 hflK [Cypionkella sp.]
MAGSGGPWGGNGGSGGDDRNGQRPEGERPGQRPGGRKPGEGPQLPEIDELMKKGQEHLRVLMGGRGGGNGRGPAGTGGPGGALFTKQGLALAAIVVAGLWIWSSAYSVKPEEQAVTLMLGKFSGVSEEGLHFAPWPVMTAEIVEARKQRTTDIGNGAAGELDNGLMLTRDQNIVDIEFQVVWNISDPAKFLFNLADPEDTIRAVSESAMRDIIARSELAPVLNRDRGVIASEVTTAIQNTLNSYDAGISVIRVNFDKADPPREVIDSFRKVQAAQQQRDQLEKQADAYANTATAGARGQAAQLQQEAEAYRAQVVNNAQGEASRFLSVYAEYIKAPEVTRKRMYLETMEKVLGGMNKVILDGVAGQNGQGVLPYLPLDALPKPATTTTTGGSN